MESLFEALSLIFSDDPELRGIIGVTLRMSLSSAAISSLIGVPLGVLLGSRDFRGRGFVMRLTGTLMSLPPVVAGLAVFLLLSRSGPFGGLKLLYTVTAMVIAQVVLITPIITGMTCAVVAPRSRAIGETSLGMGLSRGRTLLYTLNEVKESLVSVMLSGFGRAIAEVGAVSLVGGNIQYKTRVMTTAIMLNTNMGRFGFSLALGLILLTISFAVNSLARGLSERGDKKREKRGEAVSS